MPCSDREPRDVAAGSREALDEPVAHGIAEAEGNDGDGRGHRLGCPRRRVTAGHDHVDLEVDQLSDKVAKSLEPSFSRATLEDKVPPLYIAQVAQRMHERNEGFVGAPLRGR